MAWQRKAIFVYVMWFNADSGKKQRPFRYEEFARLLTRYSDALLSTLSLSHLILVCVFSVCVRLVPSTLCLYSTYNVCLVFYENSEYTFKVLLDIFLNCVVQCKTRPPGLPSRTPRRTEPTYLVAESLSLCTTLFNVISISASSHPKKLILRAQHSILLNQEKFSLSQARIHIHTCTYVIPLQCASTWTLIKFFATTRT